MQKGTVKFYNEKGFGFITPDKGKDIFFHISGWEEKSDPRKGDQVTFDTEQGKKGLVAVSIEKV